TGTEMVEKISALRPGDKVDITYKRNGGENTTSATLQGSAGNYTMNQNTQPENQQNDGAPDNDQ
ncbi:MAG: PDZ domain-containing protein, partial [Bacteroidota bacterium]|nr:PDZ domain-containing protein [Bacteroidota bacterium]